MSNVSLARIGKVMEMTTLSRASVYRLIANGTFPKPIPLTTQVVAWDIGAVQAWIDARYAEAGQKRAARLAKARGADNDTIAA